jgi:hypothetical protein
MKLAALLLLVCVGCRSTGSPSSDAPPDRPMTDSQRFVADLYDAISFAPGETPDWDAVRARFLPEAVLTLRTRDGQVVFSVDDWIADFVAFHEQLAGGGFTERVLGVAGTEYRDVAHVTIRFDSQVVGSDRPPQEGVDGFHLVRTADGWRIVSIVNERPVFGEPLPDDAFGVPAR